MFFIGMFIYYRDSSTSFLSTHYTLNSVHLKLNKVTVSDLNHVADKSKEPALTPHFSQRRFGTGRPKVHVLALLLVMLANQV